MGDGKISIEKNNESQENTVYIDPYMTIEQTARDKQVTVLFSAYVSNYEKKNQSNSKLRMFLFWFVIILLLLSLFAFVFLVFFIVSRNDSVVMNLGTVITAFVSYLTLVVSVLKVIVTYVFPKNDEQYITELVKLIQSNDLDNKKETIKNLGIKH